MIAAAGAKWAFGINAVTYLPLLVVLLLITPRGDVEPSERPTDGAGSVRVGLDWVRERPSVLAVLAATLAVGWTSDPFSTLMPALADDLGGGDATVGLLVGAFGLGAALTAPGSDRIRRRVGRSLVIPAGLAVTSIGLTVTAASPVTTVALVGAAVTGSGFLLGVTGTNAELQKAMPEALRGRVMAWWSVAFLGCRPLAALVDGGIADLAGVRVAIGVAASVAIAAAAATMLIGGRGLSTGSGD